MTEDTFKNALRSFQVDNSLINDYWNEITRNYNDPGRYYHNLGHLENLIMELLPVKDQVSDWPILICAIAYHDIIYDPLRNDNEERSAWLADERLTAAGISRNKIQKCTRLILATKHHQFDPEIDTKLFVDADLSILGKDPVTYAEYAKKVRAEYSIFPDPVYKSARKHFLKNLLDREQIYSSEFFRLKYESVARNNLVMEIEN